MAPFYKAQDLMYKYNKKEIVLKVIEELKALLNDLGKLDEKQTQYWDNVIENLNKYKFK